MTLLAAIRGAPPRQSAPVPDHASDVDRTPPAVAPPLLLGAALMFWAAMTGLWLQGALMALALEAPLIATRRVEPSRANVVRAADLALLLSISCSTYLFLTPQPRQLYFMTQPRDLFFLVLGEWTPMCLFPLAALQRWIGPRRIPVSDLLAFLAPLRVLAWPARLLGVKPRKAGAAKRARSSALNLELPFLGVVLLAAGCSDNRGEWYYPFLVLFMGWALWGSRSPRHSKAAFLLALLAAAVVGWPTQASIHAVQDSIRQRARDWPFDPLARSTALGEVGTLKLSHEVQLRVRVEPDSAPVRLPLLLREGSFNYFDGAVWMAMAAEHEDAQSAGQDAWLLAPGPVDTESWTSGRATIYQEFTHRSGLLPLPLGTALLEHLPVGGVRRSTMGQIKAESAPGLAAYTAYFNQDRNLDQAPVRADTYIPDEERAAVAQVAAEIGLDQLGPDRADEAAELVRDFFVQEFRYTLTQDDPGEDGLTPLTRFLTKTRAGHCEHFATAAAMLLRQAGIPTRYATGYAAFEYDADAGLLLVRGNHGHAWILFRSGDSWRVLDPTPPVWTEADAAEPSLWQSLADFRSRAQFFFNKLRWLDQGREAKKWLLWSLSPLLLFLGLRLFLRSGLRLPRLRGRGRTKGQSAGGPWSPLYQVEALLAREHGPRPPSEPLGSWLTSLGGPELTRAAALHNRLRFDPRSLDQSELSELRELAQAWLAARTRGASRAPRGR